jgi:hypothetical protein
MSRAFSLGLVVLALAAVVGFGAVVGPAGAAPSTTTAANTTTDGTGTHNVSIQLSKTLKITAWKFEDGKFHVTVDSATPTRLKISDTGKVAQVLAEGSGSRAVKIPSRPYTISSGTTTLTFAATTHDGSAAITFASPGGSALLRTDSIRAAKPPVERSAVQVLVLGTAAVVGFGAVVFVRRRRDTEDVDVERIA